MACYLLAYYGLSYCNVPKSLADKYDEGEEYGAYAMYKIEKYRNQPIRRERDVKIVKTIGYYPDKKLVKLYQRHSTETYRPHRDKNNNIIIRIFESGDEVLKFDNDEEAKLYFEVVDKLDKRLGVDN